MELSWAKAIEKKERAETNVIMEDRERERERERVCLFGGEIEWMENFEEK